MSINQGPEGYQKSDFVRQKIGKSRFHPPRGTSVGGAAALRLLHGELSITGFNGRGSGRQWQAPDTQNPDTTYIGTNLDFPWQVPRYLGTFITCYCAVAK